MSILQSPIYVVKCVFKHGNIFFCFAPPLVISPSLRQSDTDEEGVACFVLTRQ